MEKPSPHYPFLFSPFDLGRLRMRNRLVALPVHTGFAKPDGRVSSWLETYYTCLAGSGVAMVVVANAAVSADGMVSRFNLRADRDIFLPGLTRLAAAIKSKGALACIQLNHAGRFARTPRPLLPSPIISTNLSFNVESLKAFMDFFPFEKRFSLTRHLFSQVKTWGQAMTEADRERVIREFARAAARACRAGFDMVELHGANGYLLCQYLSPFTNKLKSGYGGDFLSRTRFPRAVIRAVRQALPKEFPLGFRLLLREWVPGGIDLPQALAFAGCLEQEGMAYISASAGTYNSLFSPPVLKQMAQNAYLATDMARLTRHVSIPTIISGRMTTPAHGEKVLARGVADLVGLGRPLRADPQWVSKAGDPEKKIRACINCHACLKQVILEKGFTCTRWPARLRRATRLEHQLLTRDTRTLWVISGHRDMQAFKACRPLLIRQEKDRSLPTLLFLSRPGKDPAFRAAQSAFLAWVKTTLDPAGLAQIPQAYTVRAPQDHWEKEVLSEIGQGGHGRIFMAAGAGPALHLTWKERLLNKCRGKIMVMLRQNNRQANVLVLVDLSDTCLLMLRCLGQTLMRQKKFCFEFIHVTTGSGKPGRWQDFKEIAGLDPNIRLRQVLPEPDLVSALARVVLDTGAGTIVMGKRGISGIKQRLLGSVSSGVLKTLCDQSVFLID